MSDEQADDTMPQAVMNPAAYARATEILASRIHSPEAQMAMLDIAEKMINPPVMLAPETFGPPMPRGRQRADQPVRPQIEAAARAICTALGEDPDCMEYPWQHWNDPFERPCWKKYIEAAEAAEACFK